jgi:beta-phosphoglucomutase
VISLEVVLEKGNRQYSNEEKVVLAERKNDYYKDMLQELDSGALLAGAIETLKLLRKKGVLIGVGSASKNTPMILEKTGLEHRTQIAVQYLKNA